MRLLAEGRTIDEIAQLRGRQRSTVVSLVSDLVERGEVEFQTGWVSQEKEDQIQKVCEQFGTEKLAPLKESALPSGIHVRRNPARRCAPAPQSR